MGSTDGDDDERPVHTVRISKPFYLGVHEVTQGQWEAVMGNNPSQFTGDPNRPVETVSWEEVQKFIGLSMRRRGIRGIACRRRRSGSTPHVPVRRRRTVLGTIVSQLGKYAWYGDNAWHRPTR